MRGERGVNQILQVAPLGELSRFLLETLPVAALAHSYLVRLRWDPQWGENPRLQEFSTNAMHELHHQMALWGSLLRLERGDSDALSDVGLNLARFLHRRQAAAQLAEGLPAPIRQDSRMQAFLSLAEQSNASIRAYWPCLSRVLDATGASGLGPTSR